MTATLTLPRTDWLARLRTIMVLRPGQRVAHLPGVGVSVSRRAVNAGGNGLLDGLIAYWPMDETNGGDILDAHTANRDVAAQTAIGYDTGLVYAAAREFLPANKDRAITTDATLQSLNAMTAAAWVYPYSIGPSPGQYRSICNNNLNSAFTAGFAVFLAHDGQVVFGASAGAGVGTNILWHSDNFVTINEWNCVIATHDPVADTISVYLDGVLKSTSYTYGLGGTSPRDFTIGRFSSTTDSGYMDGLIGPMAAWSRALSADDRAALYNAGAGLAYANFTE